MAAMTLATPYVVALLAGLLGLAVQQTRRLHLARRSSRWPSVEGELKRGAPMKAEGAVAPGRGRVTGHYWIERLRYTYTVAGRRYSGSVPSYLGAATRSVAGGPLPPDNPPRRTRVLVYYDPQDPGRAVLQPGPTPRLYVEAILAWAAVLIAVVVVAATA